MPAGFDYIQSDFSDVGATNAQTGTHYRWSGATTLSGVDSLGNTYSLDVDLTYEVGDSISYTVTVSDDPGGLGDVTDPNVRIAVWPGDNDGGHRVSGSTPGFGAGADSFVVSGSRVFGGANTAATIGDGVGFIVASREVADSPLLFSDVSVMGTIAESNMVQFTPATSGALCGDVDLNGMVTFLDIQPFIAILSANAFQAEADCDMDGAVTFLDIAPFIAALASP